MKKLIVAAVLVAGAAAATLYFSHRSRAANELASAVPADTLFYLGSDGTTQPWDNMRQLAAIAPSDRQMAEVREALAAYGPAGRMMYGLYAAYGERLAGKGRAVPGLGPRPRVAAYTIGMAPVLRLELRDPAAFRAFIDDAEKRGEVRPENDSYRGTGLRRYRLTIDGKPAGAALIIAAGEKLAVMTFDVEGFRDQVLPLALGLDAPGESLADSGILERAAETHHLNEGTVSFISYRAMIDALTGPDDALPARMLKAANGGRAPELESLRSPACRADMTAMADVIPMTVFGWAENAGDDGAQHLRAVTEIHDSLLVQTLRRLRGHLPGFLRRPGNRPVLSLALALDMSAPASVANDLWQRFTDASFQCPWLVEAQRRARAGNPAAIAMGTMMLSSLRGLSLSLYDVQMARDDAPPAKNADALATISTHDPQPLIALARGLIPALANVKFPDDGSPVALPIPLDTADPLMASVTATHIALFIGAHAARAAATLKNEGLEPNGLFYMAADYHRLAPVLLDQVNAVETRVGPAGSGPGAVDPGMVDQFKDGIRRMAGVTVLISETLDVNEQGVVLDATLAPAE